MTGCLDFTRCRDAEEVAATARRPTFVCELFQVHWLYGIEMDFKMIMNSYVRIWKETIIIVWAG